MARQKYMHYLYNETEGQPIGYTVLIVLSLTETYHYKSS